MRNEPSITWRIQPAARPSLHNSIDGSSETMQPTAGTEAESPEAAPILSCTGTAGSRLSGALEIPGYNQQVPRYVTLMTLLASRQQLIQSCSSCLIWLVKLGPSRAARAHRCVIMTLNPNFLLYFKHPEEAVENHEGTAS